MYVVDTKTSSAVNAPASVAMSAVVQVSIHRPYLLLLVQVLIDYHYLLRLVLAAIHLQPITVSPSIDPFSLFSNRSSIPSAGSQSIDQSLLLSLQHHHYYC